MDTKDYGQEPYVVDIEDLTISNDKFRVAKWTGKNLQMTVMSINVNGEVGLEKHDTHDQFLRVEQGHAQVLMGLDKNNLDYSNEASADFAIFVPAGYWHNIINTGQENLKLYSIYAPCEHAKGTIHKTYEEAMQAELEHGH
jgi:mannose-6-phosphate isomerase-like protein (cupin superfamily)